jgi:hypothetical protein
MSEAERFINILIKNNAVNYYGETSKEYLELFLKRAETMGIAQFDRPDIVIGNDSFTYFFEHFIFDSSKNTKKGTEMRKEEARVSRDFDTHVNESLKKSPDKTVISRDTYISERSIQNYISNFRRNFSNHYKKLEDYKKHAKVDELKMPYEFGFVIENTSNLPDIILNENDNTQVLLPIHLKELLELLKKSPEIKNIFYITHSNMSKYSIFYFRNEATLFREIKELGIKDYIGKKLLNLKGHSFGFAIPIPKE